MFSDIVAFFAEENLKVALQGPSVLQVHFDERHVADIKSRSPIETIPGETLALSGPIRLTFCAKEYVTTYNLRDPLLEDIRNLILQDISEKTYAIPVLSTFLRRQGYHVCPIQEKISIWKRLDTEEDYDPKDRLASIVLEGREIRMEGDVVPGPVVMNMYSKEGGIILGKTLTNPKLCDIATFLNTAIPKDLLSEMNMSFQVKGMTLSSRGRLIYVFLDDLKTYVARISFPTINPNFVISQTVTEILEHVTLSVTVADPANLDGPVTTSIIELDNPSVMLLRDVIFNCNSGVVPFKENPMADETEKTGKIEAPPAPEKLPKEIEHVIELSKKELEDIEAMQLQQAIILSNYDDLQRASEKKTIDPEDDFIYSSPYGSDDEEPPNKMDELD